MKEYTEDFISELNRKKTLLEELQKDVQTKLYELEGEVEGTKYAEKIEKVVIQITNNIEQALDEVDSSLTYIGNL